MRIPTFPKTFVKNAGYIGAIVVFFMISAIVAAVFIPKLVKPVGEIPTANLEAKIDYLQSVYPGETWYANVTVFENSRVSAHNVVVRLSSDLFGEMERTSLLILPYERETFKFEYSLPDTVKPGIYTVRMVVDADEAIPSNYTFEIQVFPSVANNTSNTSA